MVNIDLYAGAALEVTSRAVVQYAAFMRRDEAGWRKLMTFAARNGVEACGGVRPLYGWRRDLLARDAKICGHSAATCPCKQGNQYRGSVILHLMTSSSRRGGKTAGNGALQAVCAPMKNGRLVRRCGRAVLFKV